MSKARVLNRVRGGNFFLLIFLITCSFVIGETGRAQSFPFRSLQVGKAVPDVSLSGYKNEKGTTIKAHAGKPMLLVFWGGDLRSKKKRTVKVFEVLKELSPYLKKNGVVLLVINVQDDNQDVIDEVTRAAELPIPTYLDTDHTVYGKFGLYVLPSILLVDSKGKVAGGVGYSKDIKQRLKGELAVMLGEKTRTGLVAELNPQMKKVSKEEKLARRHMRMGVTMKHKGMFDSAVRELQQALDLNPDLVEARVELGCLYVEQDNLDEAIKELERGLDQQPDLLQAQLCLAKVSAKMGEAKEALADVEALVFRHGRNSELHFLLGNLQEQLDMVDKAARSYKKAYELLQRKTLLQE